ncbi:MAG: FGGY family carbohydrate kinase [Nitrososphaerota archaeon]
MVKLMTILVGIDLGTSSIKALGFNTNGDKIFEYHNNISLITFSNRLNWFEQNPKEILNNVVKLIKNICSRYRSEEIIIGFSSTSPSLVPLDEKGEPLYNVIAWMDRRACEETSELDEKIGKDNIYFKTGLHLDPLFTAVKILWLKKNRPDIFSKTRYFVQVKDYVFYNLTGEPVTDYSHISETLLYKIDGRWFDELLNVIDITPDRLFTPDFSEKIFEPSRNLRELINSRKDGLRIALGGVDSVVSTIGAGAIAENIITDTTGTSSCLDVTISSPILDKLKRFETYFHAIPGKYIIEGALPSSGEALDKILEIIGCSNKSPDEYVAELDLERPSGIVLLPFFAGTRTPDWKPELKGVIHGLSLTTSKSELVKAVMEGVAFWERRVLEDLAELGIEVSEVRGVGGGATRYWLQIKANITGIRHAALREKEASAFGAALIAGKGYNVYKDYNEIAEKLIKVEKVYEANIDSYRKEEYENYYKLFIKLWSTITSN